MKYDINSKERVKKYGEVFTPEHLVKQMCDMLQDNNPDDDVFAPHKTFLEPSCGTGNFLVEILARKLDHVSHKSCNVDEQILECVNSIYGVELLPDNVAVCKKRLLGMLPKHLRKQAKKILDEHIWCGDFLQPETIPFLASEAHAMRESISKFRRKRKQPITGLLTPKTNKGSTR